MLQGATRNLLPYATARQNIGFARLSLSGAERRDAMLDSELLGRMSASSSRPTRSSRPCPAASASDSPSPARWRRRRGRCSPTSRPASSATRTATTSCTLIHSLGDDFGTTIVVVTHQPEVAATFPRTVTMKGGRVGSEGARAPSTPWWARTASCTSAHVAAGGPGTLVRFEEDESGQLIVTRSGGEGAGVGLDGSVVLDRVTYVNGRTLLDGVSLTFPAGRVTALSGPSGSGKTTLLSIAGGLLAPHVGHGDVRQRLTWTGTGDPRPEVAFVLQVYGLVPILGPRERLDRPARPGRGPGRRRRARRGRAGQVRHRRPRGAAGRGALGAARCSAWPAPAASWSTRASCSPTSRRPSSTRATGASSSPSCARRRRAVPSSSSPRHDPAVVEACDLHYALDEGHLV